MKQKHFIDSHKALTLLMVLAMMARFDQWDNVTAWAYAALHGTYGILWVFKGRLFPDRSFEQPCSLVYGLAIWGGLSLYWIAPWIITSHSVEVPGWYLASCISVYAAGVFFHFVADMQKHTALTLRPNQLITEGMFSLCRNPNYFGELLIYAGFGLLAMHWLPMLILLVWILAVWLPRMRSKDHSLSRYPEFAAHKASSKLFLPYLL